MPAWPCVPEVLIPPSAWRPSRGVIRTATPAVSRKSDFRKLWPMPDKDGIFVKAEVVKTVTFLLNRCVVFTPAMSLVPELLRKYEGRLAPPKNSKLFFPRRKSKSAPRKVSAPICVDGTICDAGPPLTLKTESSNVNRVPGVEY